MTAAKLGSTAAATEASMRKLMGLPDQSDAPDSGAEAPGDALAKLFCRRCRIFNCMVHPGEQSTWCALLYYYIITVLYHNII